MKVAKFRPAKGEYTSLETFDLYVTRMLYAYPITTVQSNGLPSHGFIFIADTGRKDNLKFITLIFTVSPENDKDQYFANLTDCLKNTSLYDSNFDPSVANVFKMFYNDTDIGNERFFTDFILTKNTTDSYFYAKTFSDKKEFNYRIHINKQVEIGISLFNKALSTFTINDSSINEINNWLLHQYNDKNITYDSITDFKIIDISRSNKVKKKVYFGVVVLEINLSSDRTINIVMNYSRNKKVPRSISSTSNFLECVYNTAYVVLPFAGKNEYEEGNTMNLIARYKDEILILEIENTTFNKLQSEVMKL